MDELASILYLKEDALTAMMNRGPIMANGTAIVE